MALSVTHTFVSAIPDGVDTSVVRPTNWNATHTISGTLDAAQFPALTGDVTTSAGSLATTLASIISAGGPIGSATVTPIITFDAKGRLTAVSSATITPAASSVTGGAALTRVSDTNVVLTLGGSPSTALLAATSITVSWSGTLAASRGGFGADVSAAAGVPLFAAGVPTFTSTTGTGDFVRATSPALVTPDIGAASGISLSLGIAALQSFVSPAGGTFTPRLQMNGLSLAGTATARWSSDAFGGDVILAKSRSGTIGAHTIVNSGDTIGIVDFQGSNGTAFVTAATMRVEVDGTPGASDMPGRFVWAVTADGAASPTDKLILDNAGILKPAADGGVTLGTTALGYGGIRLASATTINWANGNAIITHSTGQLTSNVAFAVPDVAFSSSWNGVANAPTQNAVYDKIVSITDRKEVFTASGTFTTAADVTSATVFKITGIGGGGGGGGVAASGVGTFCAAGSGAAGSMFIWWVSGLAASTGYTVTIGGGGAGGAAGNNNGVAGGNTTIVINAVTATAPGGGGGAGAPANSGAQGGAPGAAATNGTINLAGQGGGIGVKDNVGILFTGPGGQSMLGGGTAWGAGVAAGANAGGYGNGGGAGRDAANTGGGFAGGNGSGGIVIVEWVL